MVAMLGDSSLGKLTGGVFSKICESLAPLAVALIATILALTSCTDNATTLNAGEGMTVELNIQTKSVSDITSSSSVEYLKGTQWENYIDIAGGDYRIYFFTYDPSSPTDPDSNNRLITEFNPLEVTVDEGSVYTKYTLMGRIDGEIAKYSDFKVVILANWGSDVYPTGVTTIADDPDNATTIDDICNAETAVFDAFVQNDTAVLPSETLHVPFYGVREYEGVTWSSMWRTVLSGEITLLRALAKVVVQLTNTEDDNLTVTEMNLCGYNATGYCAPKNVYLRSDYDHDYTWSQDFVEDLHLVAKDGSGNDTNDSEATNRKLAFNKIADCDDAAGTLDTWVAYVPEFDNTGTDYSYIEVLFEHQLTGDSGTGDPTPYIIYFGNYGTDGTCSAYGSTGSDTDRFDIHRNYLYSFVTTYSMGTLIVDIAEWGEVFENEWTFGETKHIIYYSDDDDAGQFTPYDDGVVYKSMVTHPDDDPDKEADEDDLAVYIQFVPASVLATGSTFYIYEYITYLDYDYKVIGIGDRCFEAEENLVALDMSQYIEYIGEDAFHGCTNLATINCHPTTPPACHENAFREEHYEDITLYVPTGSLDLYKAADVWSDFVNIEERNFGD